jgi:hypothetical protein
MPDDKATKEQQGGGEEGAQRPPDPTLRGAFIGLLHPIPLTILLILLSVFALMYPSVFAKGGGDVLAKMSDHEYARGLITYLFAVTTIGTSVVLVLAALTGALAKEENYTRGKDILALLLGVFGTIVGFYFGSEAHEGGHAATAVSMSQPLLLDSLASPGDSVRLTAFVSGGTPPYSWGVALDPSESIDYNRTVDSTGWIIVKVGLPSAVTGEEVKVRLGVRDGAGSSQSSESTIRIRKSTGPP